MFFEGRSGFDVVIAFESFESFGEKEFDVGEEGGALDVEVFADDISRDVLCGEEEDVQFFIESRIGSGEHFLAERFELVRGEAYTIHRKETSTRDGQETREIITNSP